MNEREQAAYHDGWEDCYRRANIALALEGLLALLAGVVLGWFIWSP